MSEVGSSVAVDSGDPRCMSYMRSGRWYKGSFEMSEETAWTGIATEAGRTETVDVQQVLQMLLEDRRQSELRRADEVIYLACEELLIVERPPSWT